MFRNLLLGLTVLCLFIGCGGGGGSGGGGSTQGGLSSADFGCDGGCANLQLTETDVRTVLDNAIRGAKVLGVAGTFAVLDRVGNVLAVYQMPGATVSTTINGQIGAVGGLEGAGVPSVFAAISKAGTGAYLSSQGNAFSTRTAGQIIQENFNPGERNQPGGPLFGVQFSQLICSDVTIEGLGSAGPHGLPLGLSADPGGIPLYKNGDLVGGVGVELDGIYTLDRDITDFDDDVEERIALQAARGFETPSERVAGQISAGGKSLRFTDLDFSNLEDISGIESDFSDSNLLQVFGFTDGTIRAGVVFGTPGSGVVLTVRQGVPAAYLTTGGAAPRFPTRAGTGIGGGVQLTATEVDALLDSALLTASRARAAIRRPLDTPARVSIWVVDHLGNPLGFTRSQDAPVFGIDVSLQKARAAAFFSSADARNTVASLGYLASAQALLGTSAFDGSFAFANRSIGNLARPFFVDGINGKPNGPLSLPFPGTGSERSWSPFNTGLQLDLVTAGLLAPLSRVFPQTCTSLGTRLGNGIQIFPGAVPLYRGRTLIGAIGISGDGIDQDDLIAFYGASRPGLNFAGHTGIGDATLGFNAPIDMRADQINLAIEGTRLRYVNCPEAPLSGENDQNICDKL